jgi:hypothetical protein
VAVLGVVSRNPISPYGRFLFSAMPVTRAVHQLPFTQTPGTPAYLAMAGFHLFAYIWYLCFAIGCAEFVLTGAVADWYYR